MGGLSDSLTIAILLVLIFGAVAFYLYSRLGQSEKRIGLLENLLLTLKLRTEASLEGPDTVEPVSGPAPLDDTDIESVEEENYAELLKEIPAGEVQPQTQVQESSQQSSDTVTEEEDYSRTLASVPVQVNYESMTLKELQALAKQRNITSAPRKRDLIQALKDHGGVVPTSPSPLAPMEGELEGGVVGERGFQVDLQNSA